MTPTEIRATLENNADSESVGLYSTSSNEFGFGKVDAFSLFGGSTLEIPDWIKNNADWWSQGLIDDDSFVSGIQYMITNEIIIIPNLPESSGSGGGVPDWVRNNAGWWAQGLITDEDFVKGIEFLVQNGIIVVCSFFYQYIRRTNMAIQTGISIAAIAIAVIAIGISAAMVSSIGQDMTELKSSIEKLSQTETRGVIEQQGGDRAIGGNTEESSTPGGKEVNFSPSFEMGGPPVNENLDQVENLRDKIRELQYKLRILDNTVSGVQLKEDVLPMGVDVPAGESVEREIRCWNPTSVFASFNHERIDGVEVVVEDVVDITRDTSQADAFLRDYYSIATFTNNNSDDVTVGYFIFCTKLEVPIYEAQ